MYHEDDLLPLAALRKGEKVSWVELMRCSVQLWASKIDKLRPEPLTRRGSSSDSNTYVWPYDYDPDFLGYMKGVLNVEEFISAGGAVI